MIHPDHSQTHDPDDQDLPQGVIGKRLTGGPIRPRSTSPDGLVYYDSDDAPDNPTTDPNQIIHSHFDLDDPTDNSIQTTSPDPLQSNTPDLSDPLDPRLPPSARYVKTVENIWRTGAAVQQRFENLQSSGIPELEPVREKLALQNAGELLKEVNQVAKELAVENVRLGMSRVEVAKMLGVHQGTVGRWVDEDDNGLDIPRRPRHK